MGEMRAVLFVNQLMTQKPQTLSESAFDLKTNDLTLVCCCL